MGKAKDQFGGTDAEFDTLEVQLIGRATVKAADWMIPIIGVLAVGQGLLDDWTAKYAIAKKKTAASTTDRDNKDIARVKLTKWSRKFAKKYIYDNDLLDDADVASTGLKPHKTTKTTVGKPATVPVNVYSAGNANNVKGAYRQQPGTDGVSKRGKPEGVKTIEYAIFVAVALPDDGSGVIKYAKAPVNPDKFGRFDSKTKTPAVLEFTPEESGLMGSFASRWVTATSIKGDWSSIQTFRIP